MTAWPAVSVCLSVSWSVRVGVVLPLSAAALCSADSGCRCCALLIRAAVASLCARSRGEPSSAHCEQRLSERLTPCPCEPVCACTGMRGHVGRREKQPIKQSKCWQNDAAEKQAATCISARAPTRSAASRAGMAGWAGEGGGRFGERREYEAPTLPSTPRQPGMVRHHKRQAINNTPCQHDSARHHKSQPSPPATTQASP